MSIRKGPDAFASTEMNLGPRDLALDCVAFPECGDVFTLAREARAERGRLGFTSIRAHDHPAVSPDVVYFATLKATEAVVVSHISRSAPLVPVTSANTNVNCSIE